MVSKNLAKIIEYQPKYRLQLKQVIFSVLKDLGFFRIPGSVRDADLDHINQIYSGRSRFFLAIKKNWVIGTVAIKEKNKQLAKLRRLFILTKYHGTGIGQLLLDKALQFAKEQRFKKIGADTSVVMKRAQRFYEKNGFSKIGEDEKEFHYVKTL